jgi:divalent metal cation (Fe/Co/Zn/Cd) transporter
MPQNKFALARYRLIDELLRRNRYVKTTDIVDLCFQKLGFKVTQRTIQMDLETLKNDPFLSCYFPIAYSHYKKAYYYEEKPMGFFLSFCILEDEYLLLKELRNTLKDKITEEEYQSYCAFLTKVENYLKNINTEKEYH